MKINLQCGKERKTQTSGSTSICLPAAISKEYIFISAVTAYAYATYKIISKVVDFNYILVI